MLEELYQAMKNDFKKESKPEFVNFNSFAPMAYFEEGKIKFCTPDRSPKKAIALDLDTIAAHAKEWGNGEVWFNKGRIGVFQERGDFLSDLVVMELEYSDQLKLCIRMESGRQKISQKALRDLLKIDFYRCAPESLVNVISKVNWDVQSGGESEVARGRSSLGSKITQQISGLVDIPEYVDFNIPVYKSHFIFHATLRFYLEPDAETKNFSFFPIPGQCQNAIDSAERDIGQELAKILPEGYKIYFGSCS